MLQQFVVLVAVAAAAAYAAWVLMPAAWRRALARRLGLHAPAAPACGGCDGCGDGAPRSPTAPADAARPITVHRRPG